MAVQREIVRYEAVFPQGPLTVVRWCRTMAKARRLVGQSLSGHVTRIVYRRLKKDDGGWTLPALDRREGWRLGAGKLIKTTTTHG